MINEGLSGGSVHARNDTTNIEEARDLMKNNRHMNVNNQIKNFELTGR